MGQLLHMPFLLNETAMLCCAGDWLEPHNYRAWKLHLQQGDNLVRIPTGLPEGMVECSPAAWNDSENWHLTFIAGGDPSQEETVPFHLYEMTGPSLRQLGSPTKLAQTPFGFKNQDLLVTGNKDFLKIEGKYNRRINLQKFTIYRVTYQADAPDHLLVTADNEGRFVTVRHNLATRNTERIVAETGQDVYKCSIYGNVLVHAVRSGEDFEDRNIQTSRWQAAELNLSAGFKLGILDPQEAARVQAARNLCMNCHELQVQGCCGNEIRTCPFGPIDLLLSDGIVPDCPKLRI